MLVAEFEAWPEPKALDQGELKVLIARYGNSHWAAEIIGASEAFVRQGSKKS